MKRPVLLYLISSFFLLFCLQAQTVPVGSTFDEALRQLQLQGKLDIGHSLLARPFFTDSRITTDSIYHLLDEGSQLHTTRKNVFGKIGVLEILPVSFTSKFNSDHPYGWNESGMLQAKGWQTRFSTGIYFAAGPLSIQCKPEWVTAGNPEFTYNTLYGAPGRGSYQKLFLGQSSIRLNAGPLSAGISTESLWWGPGIYNSLLMSNNSPGFAHLTFNTRRPLKTPIGNFEWQVIMGKLVEDPQVLLENKNLTTSYYNPLNYDGSGYSGPYDPNEKWRYLNALTISYNPKWIKGFFVGLNRVAYTYDYKLQQNDFGFFHKYFPTLFGAFRENYRYGTAVANLPIGYKQIVSIDFRFVFPKSGTEMYAEYGVHDNAYNIRDFNLDPEHAAAYTVGIKKMKSLGNDKWLDINFELTRMAQPVDYLIRLAGDWYQFQGGYTHQNRVIGAGVGPGNNVQTLKATWIKGFTKIGLKLQSIKHQPVLADAALPLVTLGLHEYNWTDLAIGASGQYHYKKFIASAELQFINSKYYAWMPESRFNFYGLINIAYIW
jgi:hypothetical protein